MQYKHCWCFFASPIIIVDFAVATHLVYDNFSLMRIKSPVNIFIYLDILIIKLNLNIFEYSFVIFKLPKYIQIFIRLILSIWIYSDIHLFHLRHGDIFGYSFDWFYTIRIYSDIHSSVETIFATPWVGAAAAYAGALAAYAVASAAYPGTTKIKRTQHS